MSWLSKINSQVDGLLNKDGKANQQSGAPPNGQRGYEYPPQQQYGGYPNQSPQPYQQQQYGPPQPAYGTYPYASPPPQQPYSAPPQQPYSVPPPQQPYSAPPPQPYGTTLPQGIGLPPTPSLPPGWTALWDPQGSRWAYLEQWNNLVSWTFPTGPSAGGAGGYDPSRGYQGGAGGYAGEAPSYDQSTKPKDNGKKNMIMGAVAGVAVGAVGGAILANALDDDEHRGNGPLPDETASGSSVSSSDREEVEEAREEYEEVYEEVYD